ncbi:YhgE/Pip domain-containing protein [Risungbinella massiliensis]|uniref:YhgE/Pip domain-containing protein n=1 Tax=Risungbinella massiliensis TaxID=1329796 RepID=UPI0005CB953D|nr:DUF3533 domain-containing protein [Risungbinella massiliensis]
MNVFRKTFQNKLFWGALMGMLLIVTIFTFAFMGSTINPTPKNVPIAFVTLDQGVELPNKTKGNFGNQLQTMLLQNENLPVKWSIAKNKAEVIQGMKEQRYYGAIIVVDDFTRNMASLITSTPQKPNLELIINQGMNNTAVTAVNQILDRIVSNVNTQIQSNSYQQLAVQKVSLTVEQAQMLANPLEVKTELQNAAGAYTGNGNLPTLFTQILWITTFISSMICFTLIRKATERRISIGSVLTQLLGGSLFVGVISSLSLLIAMKVLDADVADATITLGYLFFTGIIFFLIQSSVLNWFGFAGAPLMILLFFFSMPVLSLPPEFMPSITRDALYDWNPLKFAVEGLRIIFFFESYQIQEAMQTLGMIGCGAGLLMALSPLRFDKVSKEKRMEANIN